MTGAGQIWGRALTYIRGNGSVNVELARIQSWAETTDPEVAEMKLEMQQNRDERSERKGAVKTLKVIAVVFGSTTFIQLAMWIFGLIKHGLG